MNASVKQTRRSPSRQSARLRHTRPSSVSDLCRPPPRWREKVTGEYDNRPATTFGKAPLREGGGAKQPPTPGAAAGSRASSRAGGTTDEGHLSLAEERGAMSKTVAGASSSRKEGGGGGGGGGRGGCERFSAWAAPPHHVKFNGSVPLEDLPKRAASALASMDTALSFSVRPTLPGASAAMAGTDQDRRSRSALGDLRRDELLPRSASVEGARVMTGSMIICGAQTLVKHRNCSATTVDGRPVSTFGGVEREAVDYASSGCYVRLTPGPGHYTPHHSSQSIQGSGGRGLLGSGSDRANDVILTRTGLIGEGWSAAAPASRAPTRAELESRATQRALQNYESGEVSQRGKRTRNARVPATSTISGNQPPANAPTAVPQAHFTPAPLVRPQLPQAAIHPEACEKLPAQTLIFQRDPRSSFLDELNTPELHQAARDAARRRGQSREKVAAPGSSRLCPAVYWASHTHNTQLRDQEQRRKRLFRVPF